MEQTIADSFFNWIELTKHNLHHRQLLVISGGEQWAQETAESAIKRWGFSEVLWCGNRLVEHNHIAIEQFKHYLGQEFEGLIYNAHSGIRANALMALSGTVCAQGVMIVLCPSFDDWPQYDDPQNAKKYSYGFMPQKHGSHFIKWLSANFVNDPYVAILSDQQFKPAILDALPATEVICKHQQKLAIEAIKKTAHGRKNRPLVITADRGRGKTSALGLASAQLISADRGKVIITAPNFTMVKNAFEHAQGLLANASLVHQTLEYKNAHLEFIALDQMVEKCPEAELILVDEAAAIPTDTLKQICSHYPRVVFSTTIHGYEGSGRGFEIRFKQYLDTHYSGWRNIHIDTPMRWYERDTLEQFWFNTMLMHNHGPSNLVGDFNDIPVEYSMVSQQKLLSSPKLLSNVFGLLVNAHYQTSPDDLNRILDAPDQQLYVATANHQLIAVALVTIEGGRSLQSIAEPIAAGQRRVQGHLAAQSLAYMTGQSTFSTLNYLRISRIAVSSQYQSKQIGSNLLTFIKQQAETRAIDFMSVSFGLEQELLKFWTRNQYSPVKLGARLDASSGEFSALLLNPLTDKAKSLALQLENEFRDFLIYQASRKYKQLNSQLIAMMLLNTKNQELTQSDMIKLDQLINKNRHWDSCELSIKRLLLSMSGTLSSQDFRDYTALVSLFIQNAPQTVIQNSLNLTGKKQLGIFIGKAVASLLASSKTIN